MKRVLCLWFYRLTGFENSLHLCLCIDKTKKHAMVTFCHQTIKMITANNERVTTRINTQVKATLSTAANLTGSTLNQFMVHAALEKAEKLIEQDKIIKLSKLDSEVFFAALEKAPSANKKLKAAFEKYQKAI